jgi:hypothetical protein
MLRAAKSRKMGRIARVQTSTVQGERLFDIEHLFDAVL